MKTKFVFLLLCLHLYTITQALTLDPKIVAMGWSFLSPIALSKIDDPLTKEIVSKAIPKIINDDIKGAVLEISDATYRVKKVKILNKAFLAEQEIYVNNAVKALRNQDYARAINEVATIVTLSDKYLKKGTLDKEDAKRDNELNTDIKSTVVKTDEINGRFVIEKSNSYYFFVPNGYVSPLQSNDTMIAKYNLNLSSNRIFEIGIIKTLPTNEKWSVEYLEANPSVRDGWTNLISKTILRAQFGDGTASPASLVNAPNFKAYKLPYLVANNSMMTTTYLAFHNAQVFMIYFKSSQADFINNIKSFEEIISMFFFGEKIPFCQMKKCGKARIVNKSTNPYDLFQEGEFVETIQGRSEYFLNVPVGTSNLKAIQKSGFMVYPTQNERIVTIENPCDDASVEIGFED